MEKKLLEREFKKRPSLGGIFNLFFLFSLTLALGVLVALRLVKFFEIQEEKIAPVSLGQFLLNFLLALLLMGAIFFLGKKFKKRKRVLLKTLFLATTGLGSLISLGVFVGDFAILLVLVLLLLWLKKPSVFLQDILVIFGIAGAGSFLGIRLSPKTVVLLLAIFSIYDYLAVYKTKHMVKMAKEMIEEGAIVGLVLPLKISDFSASLKEVRPGGRFFVLGGGDVAFPLLLSCSLLTEGLTSSLVVAAFSLLGLFFGFLIFTQQKSRRPIPALPPIALFSIIGYLITLII